MSLDTDVQAAVSDGYAIVQQGWITRAPGVGVPLSDRVEAFNVRLVGAGDKILDDGERVVHLRKRPK